MPNPTKPFQGKVREKRSSKRKKERKHSHTHTYAHLSQHPRVTGHTHTQGKEEERRETGIARQTHLAPLNQPVTDHKRVKKPAVPPQSTSNPSPRLPPSNHLAFFSFSPPHTTNQSPLDLSAHAHAQSLRPERPSSLEVPGASRASPGQVHKPT